MDDTKKLIEKYKRELMELSKTAPRAEPAGKPAPKSQDPETAKAPRVIGYVTEESGEFPAIFDKFITEAVENNEIETIRSAPPGDDEMSTQPDDDMSAEPADEFLDTPPDTFDEEFTNDETPKPTAPPADNAPDSADLDEMSHGTGESINDFPVPVYSSLEDFEANNRGGGSLEFRVFTAREAMPVEGAYVVVSTRIGGSDREMFNSRTNSSGETEMKILPAPSKELSQHSDNAIQPFSLYNASIEKDGYVKVILRDIPIFDGVQSVQRVAMIPELQSEDTTEEITEVNDAK